MPPLVSLVVSHTNPQASLPGLLDSILAQSLKEVEVLLVDDCPDVPGDSPGPLVAAYREKGLDIRGIAGGGIRAGMAAARAGIVAFAQAGDTLWGTEALERNVRRFLREKPDILHFRTALVDDEGQFQAYAEGTDPFGLSLSGEDIFTEYITSPGFKRSFFLWSKFLSRELCGKIHDHALHAAISGRAEHCCLATLAMFHARTYIGSREVGYGRCDRQPQDREGIASAVGMYHAVREIPACLERQGCSQKLVAACTRALHNIFCDRAGKLVLAVEPENGSIADAALDALLEQVDEDTLLEVLLLGNYLHVQKILGCFKSLSPPVTVRPS